ncbi:MAG: PIN domain-containing protein [Euryarchaeota archaeon]|nr:PIN domain-containing protein [Euryarchaeota archaeon]
MRVVILDATVLVACLFKDGRARDVLLHALEVQFVAPPDVLEEAEAQLSRVAQRVHLPETDVRAVLRELASRVKVVPLETLRLHEARAREVAKAAGDESDWEYVALALASDAPVWTYDKYFRWMKGIALISTSAVLGRG